MVPIGKINIDAPFFQAGLAGYSDAAMRLIARRHGAPFCVTEAMLDQFLIGGGKGLAAAELDGADHPIAGQLMGSHPREIAQGARILVGLGYDAIDVNLACPVKKIRKKCRGGHLLAVPEEAVAVLDEVRQAVGDDRPCTVKLRRGTNDSPEAEAAFHQIFEAVVDLGYAAAVIHGRSVEQKYHGPSRWSFLRALVKQYGHVEGLTIGGSGDIWTAHDIFEMIARTGVDMVSVARGCIGNPWIFTQARQLMLDPTGSIRGPSIAEQCQVLMEHFRESVRLHGEDRGSRMMRKFGIKFATHHPNRVEVGAAFIAVKSLNDWRDVLKRHYGRDRYGASELHDTVAGATEKQWRCHRLTAVE